MRNLTKNEMLAVLTILKSPETLYNARNLSGILGISHMGCLKILKKLEKENILKSEHIGRSIAYRINVENQYSKTYVQFLLSNEAENSSPAISRWVHEIRKIKNCDLAILFGSLLRKSEPQDIDILFVTDQQKFDKLKKEVSELNQLNVKKIHPIYQSKTDLIENIKRKDKVILNAIKGIVAIGEERFLEVYEKST